MTLRALPLLLLLAACADFPEVTQATANAGPTAPPPALLPMDQILAQTTAPRAETAGNALNARAAALRARAAALRAR